METAVEDKKGLEFQSLSKMKPEEKVLSAIDYGRPLTEYATPEQIATFLLNREKSYHVYTKDLQVGGTAVADAMEKYLGSSDHYPSSSLKEALKTPLHLYYAKESGWKDELDSYQKNKDHFALGTFLHMCMLEPTKFRRTTVEPKFSLASKEGVEALINFWIDKIQLLGQCEVEGQVVDIETGFKAVNLAVQEMGLSLDKQDGKKARYNMLKKISGLEAVSEEHALIIDIVRQNYERYGGGIIPQLLKHSKREISLYYTDPLTGVNVRCRPDAMQFSENIGVNAIISVKSTQADSLEKFYYDAAKYKYELTEAMYQEVASGVTGRDFNCTITIMLQTKAPYGVALMVWDAEDIEIGKFKYHQALQTVKECKETGLYPGYDAYAESGNFGLISMKLPQWAGKDLLPTDIED